MGERAHVGGKGDGERVTVESPWMMAPPVCSGVDAYARRALRSTTSATETYTGGRWRARQKRAAQSGFVAYVRGIWFER